MSSHFYIRDFSKRTHDDALSDKSLLSLSETKSEHTIDAYESDWNDFCDWCAYHKKESFPTTPETIVNYINDLADYAKTATIRRLHSSFLIPNLCHSAWMTNDAFFFERKSSCLTLKALHR